MVGEGVLKGLDYFSIFLSVTLALLCCCAALPSTSGTKRDSRITAAAFSSLSSSRITLILTGGGWALIQILRLQVVWSVSDGLAEGGQFCRLYVFLSMGCLQPFFLWLVFFILTVPLRHRAPLACLVRPGYTVNTSVMCQAAIMTIPYAILQALSAWFTSITGDSRTWIDFQQLSFSPWSRGSGEECWEAGGDMVVEGASSSPGGCKLCTCPVLSWGLSAAFTAGYLAVLAQSFKQDIGLRHTMLNRPLQRRAAWLVSLLGGAVLALLVWLGLTAIGSPHGALFEFARFAHQLTVIGIVVLVVWVLGVKPICEANSADKRVKSMILGDAERIGEKCRLLGPVPGSDTEQLLNAGVGRKAGGVAAKDGSIVAPSSVLIDMEASAFTTRNKLPLDT